MYDFQWKIKLTKLKKRIKCTKFNPLQPGVAYLYPLKSSENFYAFWCFQGV